MSTLSAPRPASSARPAATAGRHDRAPRRSPGLLRATAVRSKVEFLQFYREPLQVFFGFAFPIVLFAIFATIFDSVWELPDGSEVGVSTYYLAGMIAAAVMTSGFQSTAEIIATERDDRTLRRLSVSPMPRSAYLLGKIVLVVVNTVLQTAALLLVARYLFEVPMPHSPGTFAWVLVLGTAAATAVGIAFASVLPSGRAAIASAAPITVVLSFFSGSYIPMSELPEWLQNLGYLFPQAWIARGLRASLLPEEFQDVLEIAPFGLQDLQPLMLAALVLGAWLVVTLVLARRTFRWSPRDAG